MEPCAKLDWTHTPVLRAPSRDFGRDSPHTLKAIVEEAEHSFMDFCKSLENTQITRLRSTDKYLRESLCFIIQLTPDGTIRAWTFHDQGETDLFTLSFWPLHWWGQFSHYILRWEDKRDTILSYLHIPSAVCRYSPFNIGCYIFSIIWHTFVCPVMQLSLLCGMLPLSSFNQTFSEHHS